MGRRLPTALPSSGLPFGSCCCGSTCSLFLKHLRLRRDEGLQAPPPPLAKQAPSMMG